MSATETDATTRTILPVQQRFSLLLLLVGLSELGYLLLFALSPLPGLRLSNTPLTTAWTWTQAPSRWLVTMIDALYPSFQYNNQAEQFLLALVLLLLVIVYILAVTTITRSQTLPLTPFSEQETSRWCYLIIGGTLLFGLTLLFMPKLFADDVFNYIFSGRILAIYRANPLNTAPVQYPFDVYLHWAGSGRNAPNIYGPLWLCVTFLLVSVHGNPITTLLLFKGLALLAHLCNCLLIWHILGRIAPSRRILGTLLYAWNPLVLIELAGSGHSEGLLMSLLLLAVLLHVSQKGGWGNIGVLIVFGLAISLNLVVLFLAPLYLWFETRNERKLSPLLYALGWRVVIVLLPGLLVLLPFWRGSSTFFALTSAVDMEHFVHSPVAILSIPLRIAFTWVANGLHFSASLQPITSANITVRASATVVFALIYFEQFNRVRHAPTTIAGMRYSPGSDQEMNVPGFDTLLTAWSATIFWYMLLASGWFWPWYLLWILWAFVLRRLDIFTTTFLVLSGTALLLYPLLPYNRTSFAAYQTTLIFGIPLLYLIIVTMRKTIRERTPIDYDRGSETAKN